MTAGNVVESVKAFVSLQAGQKYTGLPLGFSVFGACLFGSVMAIYIRILFIGALRLGRNGFVVTLFGRQQYLWRDVYDFRPYYFRSFDGIQFDAAERPLSGIGAKTAKIGFGYTKSTLIDTFGLEAEELVDLMQSWQSAALDGQED